MVGDLSLGAEEYCVWLGWCNVYKSLLTVALTSPTHKRGENIHFIIEIKSSSSCIWIKCFSSLEENKCAS